MEQNTIDNFDFAGWKKSGEEALESLRQKERVLEAELKEVRQQTKDIMSTLGKQRTSGKKKIRLGPRIESILVVSKGEELLLEDLFTRVQAVSPDATRALFTKSLKRLADKNPNIVVDGSSVTYR